MTRLVYLSPVPWSSFAQRPHKFVTWFHARKGGDVLWWIRILPAFRGSPISGDSVSVDEPENEAAPPWLKVIRPTAIPVEPLPGSGLVNALVWRPALREIQALGRREDCLLAIGKPSLLALAVLKQFKGCRAVYDAMDDFPAFYTGVSRWAMRRRERLLVRGVDAVLASSRAVRPSGRIRTMEAGAQRPDEECRCARQKPGMGERKVLGYVGTIAAFRLGGDRLQHAERCGAADRAGISPHPPACRVTSRCGRCSHRAMSAMQEFDVGLIPFKKNDVTASVDPIK